MSTSVKYIDSNMRGAPQINGTAGRLITALDALFTTGWGVTTAVSVNVASGIATATLTPGETFFRDAVVLVAGATPSDLNGEARVLTSSNTSISWATTAADGVATGTITIKYAPQTSWVKGFAGTNKAEYHSTHVQSRGHSLRIDDTGTTTARVRGYESMTDIETGIGPFPTLAQVGGSGGSWVKNAFSAASNVRWFAFCDEQFLLLAVAGGVNLAAGYTSAPLRGFGDLIALAPSGDAWATVLGYGGATDTTGTYTGCFDSGAVTSGVDGGCAFPRAVTGLGGGAFGTMVSESGLSTSFSGGDSTFGNAPSSVDGQIKMSRRLVREGGSNSPPRAVVPGAYSIPQAGLAGLLALGDILEGSGPLANRRLMAIHSGNSCNSLPSGAYLVDITGPWR